MIRKSRKKRRIMKGETKLLPDKKGWTEIKYVRYVLSYMFKNTNFIKYV
jgi:hypothetical protein